MRAVDQVQSADAALIISANALLISKWQSGCLPCVALQISRNFRLLQACTTLPDLILDYQRQAQAWLLCYQQRNKVSRT